MSCKPSNWAVLASADNAAALFCHLTLKKKKITLDKDELAA